MTSKHVNKNRFKFHELEEEVFLNSNITGEELLCFNQEIHQSGINSIDVVVDYHENKGINEALAVTLIKVTFFC